MQTLTRESNIYPAPLSENILLKGVIESLLDGILILTTDGEIIEASVSAQQVCDRLTPNPVAPGVPKEVWRLCQSLIESRNYYSDHIVVLEDELNTEQFPQLRICVRWVSLKTSSEPYILVLIEDRHQANQRLAIAESFQYHLTPRETDVWQLYRTNYSRKEIAKKLFISIDTVKKHIKSSRAKRQMFLYENCN